MFKAIVSSEYAVPLTGTVNNVDQVEHARQQRNYLHGGTTVTIIKEEVVLYRPLHSSTKKELLAYQIEGVNGWFSEGNFKLLKE